MKRKLPRFNKRPQLWYSEETDPSIGDRLRIVYPSGRVMYYADKYTGEFNPWRYGCTSRSSQREAVQAIFRYSALVDPGSVGTTRMGIPQFVGYL